MENTCISKFHILRLCCRRYPSENPIDNPYRYPTLTQNFPVIFTALVDQLIKFDP